MTPRKTAADYAAIAVAPVLIFLMISSLASFLMLVLYRGGFQQRLTWILLMYTMGAVSVARIAIERDRAYSLGYAGALGLATFVSMLRFLDSAVFSAFILVVIAYLADVIVRDCTLIDDDVDASGQGLIDSGRLFLKKKVEANAEPRESTGGVTALHDSDRPPPRGKRKTHQPGRTVMYLALGALPLFGLGQFLIRNDPETWARAQRLLAFYLFASLSLLVTTSFLGLRRYLRQRKTEMPKDVSVAWLAGGLGLIAAVLFIAYIAPMPGRAIASFELPTFDSPGNTTASRYGWGDEGADRSDPDASKTTDDPNADRKEIDSITAQKGAPPGDAGTGNRDDGPGGDQKGGNKSGGKGQDGPSKGKKSQGQQSQGQQSQGQQSQGQQSQGQQSQGEKSQGQKSQESDAPSQSPDSQQSEAQQSESSEESNSQPPSDSDAEQSPPNSNQPNSNQPKSSNSKNSSSSQQNSGDRNAEPQDAGDTPPSSESSVSESIAGAMSMVGSLIKFVVFLVLAGIVGTFLWTHRHLIREWLDNLLGQKDRPATETFEEFLNEVTQVPPRSFSSFHNPIGKEPDLRRIVVITFQAFEAWTREHGTPRARDETPAEFIRRVSKSVPQMSAPATQIVEAYNRIVYGRGVATQQDLTAANQVWNAMQSQL